METRANYILIGAFTLAGMVGLVGFFLWFARVELNAQFAYYDISFSSVAGLGNASDVRFGGLPVGQVVDVRLSPERDGTILVRIEVGADTPVRTDSIATIESQGVTGVSFVGISPGTPEAALLRRQPGELYPKIESGRSVLQTLSEDGPQLLTEALEVVRGVGDLLSGENQQRIDHILTNLEAASADFAQALADFSKVTDSVSGFAEQVDRFNTTLDGLTGGLTEVLATADETLTSIGALSEEARGAVATGQDALTGAQGIIAEAERYLAEDLSGATAEVRLAVTELRGQVAVIGADARAMIAEYQAAGTAATARLTEAQATLAATDAMIANLDATLVTVEGAAAAFDALIEGDGAVLVAETRVAVAAATAAMQKINAAADTDLPAIVADLRGATETFNRVVAELGADLTGATGRIDGLADRVETTLATVTTTFASANETLTAINAALEVGERTLAAAERTFDGADQVINEDVAVITADLRVTLTQLNEAIAQVSAEIPAIVADVRSASEAAEATFAELGRITGAAGAPVQTFATTALPDYARLAQETRTLVSNLDRLVTQIQRDPARFFLNRETPDFRR